MGTSEKFCLRWNDFENNISGAFRELREDKDFFDVTLACDDDQIQAHKAIPSACSPLFQNVLRHNPHQHPLLEGVKYTDLQSVLNFMHHVEVSVAQEELKSYLAVAEDLIMKRSRSSEPRSCFCLSRPSPLLNSPMHVITPSPAAPANGWQLSWGRVWCWHRDPGAQVTNNSPLIISHFGQSLEEAKHFTSHCGYAFEVCNNVLSQETHIPAMKVYVWTKEETSCSLFVILTNPV